VIFPITESQKEHFKKMGRMFGYPECCINDFLIVELPRRQSEFTGTGYVPCEVCSKKSRQELLDVIAINRKFPKPFPLDE
jgi:hypothetical protein